ncbi:MAG TPA: hypothetical protein DCS93_28190 [Microscillaceae bacterium]|nr:hypothetical protein [Microscillaceae bacterium]
MKYLSFIVLFALVGCSPKLTKNWTSEKYTSRSFKKIAVVAVTKDLNVRKEFENQAIKLLKKRGINVIEGIKVFPPGMTEAEKQPKNLIKLIKAHQIDGVITMSLVDQSKSMRYIPKENVTVPSEYDQYGKFTFMRYESIQKSGYFIESKRYLIEAVLHDLKGELYEGKKTLVWIGQSTLVDPKSVGKAAKKFVRRMVNGIVASKVINSK